MLLLVRDTVANFCTASRWGWRREYGMSREDLSSCGFCAPNQLIVASQPIRMYVDAGQQLLATANFSGPIGANGSVFASISGYLVNAE
jgi:hypothetical protein